MYPIIVFCKIFYLNYDVVFGLVIISMMGASWLLLSKVISNLTNIKYPPAYFALFAAINIFVTQLNGRMFFAFMGMSIFLYLDQLVKRKAVPWYYLLLGLLGILWLCSVSSGAMLLAYGISIVWIILFYKPLHNENYRLQQAALLVGLAMPYKIVYESIAKNVDFFGGGLPALLNMLNHGAGLFMKSKMSVVLLFLAMLIAYFMWNKFKPKSDVKFALFTFIVGLLGGLYGWSVTMVAFPAIFLIAFVKLVELMPMFTSRQERLHACQ